MTREEAIKNIKEHCYFASLLPQAKEALDITIKALEQEVCEDCINREQAINEIEEWADGFEEGEYFSGKSVADAIRACGGIVAELPSVQPEVKTSHWICTPVRLLVDESYDEAIYGTKYKCTCESCGGDFGMMWKEWHPEDNYCKYCGAKMESEGKECD